MKVIQSIQRAINIINCFDSDNSQLTLNQISEMLSLNINTTRGITNTLVYNDLLEYRSIENHYRLGSFFLSKAELSSRTIIEKLKHIVRPYLQRFADKYNTSTRLQLVFGSDIMTIATASPDNAYYKLVCEEYVAFPLHATSSGKLFLKYNQDRSLLKKLIFTPFTKKTVVNQSALEKELQFIDEKGYAKESDEISLGISSIAIPIFQDNKLFATISLTGLSPVIEEIEEDASLELLSLQQRITKDFLQFF